MVICILRNPKRHQKEIHKGFRGYIKKDMDLDEAVYLYLLNKGINVEYRSIDYVLKNNNKYSIVYTGSTYYGFGDLATMVSKKRLEDISDKLSRIKNLVPSLKYMKMIGDKCNYYNAFKKYMANTLCSDNIKTLDRNKEYFIKPAMSAFSRNVYHKKKGEIFDGSLFKKGRRMMVQEYRKFATQSNPEFRCYFVYNKFGYCVATKGGGDTVRYVRLLPVGLKLFCNKIMKRIIKLENRIVLYRIDCYKWKNKWYVNEIEGLPGIINEDLSRVKFELDRMIGERLIELSK